MAERPVFLTAEGLAKLRAELEYLRNVRRPQVAARIHQAKEFVNTSDDAEYEDAKNEQAFVEGRILTLESMLENAVLIAQSDKPADSVRLGSTVTVIDAEGERETYVIVGSAEADPKSGRISNESPVGQALLGRRVGDEVQVAVPAGILRFKVVEIA